MKVITRHICGADRVLCYSLRVARGISERFGRDGIRSKLGGEHLEETMDAVIWLLGALMDAGKRYADRNGIECPEPPTEDELLDLYDINDLLELQSITGEAIEASSQQDVTAESKNV